MQDRFTKFLQTVHIFTSYYKTLHTQRVLQLSFISTLSISRLQFVSTISKLIKIAINYIVSIHNNIEELHTLNIKYKLKTLIEHFFKKQHNREPQKHPKNQTKPRPTHRTTPKLNQHHTDTQRNQLPLIKSNHCTSSSVINHIK